jgi:hypothetical protein
MIGTHTYMHGGSIYAEYFWGLGMHTPCQSSGQLQNQSMLLARERLGQRDNRTAVFGTGDPKTGIWRACQASVTSMGVVS